MIYKTSSVSNVIIDPLLLLNIYIEYKYNCKEEKVDQISTA